MRPKSGGAGKKEDELRQVMEQIQTLRQQDPR